MSLAGGTVLRKNEDGTPLKTVASMNGLPEALIKELRQWWVNQGPSYRAQEVLESWGYLISHAKLMRWCEHAWPELDIKDEECLEDPDASNEENTRRLLARKGLMIARQINVDDKRYATENLKAAAQALKEITAAALQIEKAEAERVRTEEYRRQVREEEREKLVQQLHLEIHGRPDIVEYLGNQLEKPMRTETGEPLQ